ncbi:MAG TPA: substrate-binding domain-containing protein, partial [Micromonosporaceae bacterium]
MTGQHRRAGRSGAARALITLLVLALIAAAGVGSWYGYRAATRHETSASCVSKVAVSVAAAPEIAPAVSQLASSWNAHDSGAGGVCVRFNVSAVAPASEAAAIAGAAKVSVGGLGQANGDTSVADVWIPDSSTWLSRLAAASPTLAMTGTS